MAAILPPDHWRLDQLAGQLVTVYEALGEPARAAGYRSRGD
jgi:hypothetical protein